MTVIAYDIQERIRRGKAAERLRTDDMIQDVLAGVRQSLYRQFEDSKSSAQRDEIHATLRGLTRIMDGLLEIENAGKVASAPPRTPL